MDILEIVDVISVFMLIFLLYRLVKGTIAINIFLSLALIYLFWQIVTFFELKLLSSILGQFIGFGVIILAIIFQNELRKFLIILGKGNFLGSPKKNFEIFKFLLLETISFDNSLPDQGAVFTPLA